MLFRTIRVHQIHWFAFHLHALVYPLRDTLMSGTVARPPEGERMAGSSVEIITQ